MPEIVKIYTLPVLAPGDLYQECTNVLKEMGGQDFQQHITNSLPFKAEISATIPSPWAGWGGMKIQVSIEESGQNVILGLTGYIAQLGVSPLTKRMDIFLNGIAVVLKNKYNFIFKFEKLNRFLPTYNLKFTKGDMTIIVSGIVLAFLSTVADSLHSLLLLGVSVIGLVVMYRLGREMLK